MIEKTPYTLLGILPIPEWGNGMTEKGVLFCPPFIFISK